MDCPPNETCRCRQMAMRILPRAVPVPNGARFRQKGLLIARVSVWPNLAAVHNSTESSTTTGIGMEIQALRLTITEEDLNALLKEHLPPDQPVENIHIRVAPEGVYVKGMYPLFINVSFETHWDLSVREGKVLARLANLRTLGVPGNVFKSAIMKLVADAAKSEPWLTIDRDTVMVDVDAALVKHGLATARANLTRVLCDAGRIVVEAASP